MPHWHQAAYHGEILIYGQFLALPELAFMFGVEVGAHMEKAPAHRSASPATSALSDPQPTRLRGWQEPWAGHLQPSHPLAGRAARSCLVPRPLSSAPRCAAKRRPVESSDPGQVSAGS